METADCSCWSIAEQKQHQHINVIRIHRWYISPLSDPSVPTIHPSISACWTHATEDKTSVVSSYFRDGVRTDGKVGMIQIRTKPDMNLMAGGFLICSSLPISEFERIWPLCIFIVDQLNFSLTWDTWGDSPVAPSNMSTWIARLELKQKLN